MNSRGQKIILLVEDEPSLAKIEGMVIEKFGYKIIFASTGEKAVECVEEFPDIDLILMDINLGSGIDGTQAAREILEKRHLPIVFLTSHSEKEYVDRVKAITRYGYIVKNSGSFVLQSSIEMAFELFESNKKNQLEKEFNQTLFDNLPAGIVARDDRGMLALFNKTSSAWHGVDIKKLPPEEWGKHYGLYDVDGVPPLSVEQIPLFRAFKGERFKGVQMSIVEGKPPRYISVNGAPFYGF